MTSHAVEPSSRIYPRLAGALYLITILTGAFAAMSASGRLVANLIATACYIAVTLLFYSIFKPVNRSLSLLAAVVSLVGCALGALSTFLVPEPVSPLVFFGLYCLLIGYLVFKSTFLPRVLGALMAFGGLGWLTFASPALASSLSPYNMAPGVLGEGALTVWLLVRGLDVRKWRERASAWQGGPT